MDPLTRDVPKMQSAMLHNILSVFHLFVSYLSAGLWMLSAAHRLHRLSISGSTRPVHGRYELSVENMYLAEKCFDLCTDDCLASYAKKRLVFRYLGTFVYQRSVGFGWFAARVLSM